MYFFFFKQKTAYEMRISDWSSDVCSSDLPEDLTRVALGVVANVQGAVSGTGQIRWDRNSVSSDGRFGTQDMSLAAAFGPVTGLDRKSVVEGKSVSVRVDLGGRRNSKKKKEEN